MKNVTNPADIRPILESAIKNHSVDYCDIRYEIEESSHISFMGKDVQASGSQKMRGGIVRACHKGGWGHVLFNDIGSLKNWVEQASTNARHAARKKTELAEVPIIDAEYPFTMKRDFRTVPFDEKLKTLSEFNEALRTFDDAIRTTNAAYREVYRTVWFASSEGAYYMEERPTMTAALSVKAGKGDIVQTAFDSIRSSDDYGAFLSLEDKIETIGKRSLDLLSAPRCEKGVFPVILDQDMGGLFIHEAFGHLSEADHMSENEQLKEIMKLGRKLGKPILNVCDDGTMPLAAGTHGVDDEGTPVGKTQLIKDGVICGFLHSRETAGMLGMAPTGNARAIDQGFGPIVRMRNTIIENGTSTFDELIRDIDDGYYICGGFGGVTQMEQFTFTPGYGFRIKNGKLDHLVRDLMLTGNVFETLGNIDGIANDFRLKQSAGGCGKNGQGPLPISHGAPHIRIQNVVTGGK